MRLSFRWLSISVGVIFLVGLTTSAALAQDPDNGKALWEGQVWQCAACHGQGGEGVFGKPLAGDASLTAADYIAQVRSPKNRMPAFSEAQVTDEQLTDMHAYMVSLPTAAPAFQQIELAADAHPGQTLVVEKRCVACHSHEGPPRDGEAPTIERVLQQLRTPFKNMPSYTTDQVSDADAALIAEFWAQAVTAPEALPQSGAETSSQWPLVLLVAGGLVLFGGLVVRRVMAHS